MNIPVSRLLPATVVVTTMVLGFKVVALATTSSEAVLRVGVAEAAATQEVQMSRRAVQLASSEQPEGGRSLAPSRGARVPAVPAAVPMPLRTPSNAPPADQAVSVQGVFSLSAAAPTGQAPLPSAAGASFGTPAPVPPPPAPPLVLLAQVAPAGPASAPAPRTAVAPAEDSIPRPDALKIRRSQIEERERALVEREALAAASEKRLSDRVSELTVLQARLQALETGLKERDEANWSGMVKTYETMRPKDAALIFNALEKPVLIEILDRMKPAKATPVIAAMDPEKARQLTADLAARRTRSTTLTH